MNKKTLPYKYYYILILILVIAGILDTIYLTLAHYKNYTDLTYSSFCALSKAINCDTVSQSPWSIVFGLPLSVWGLFGYSYFLLLLFFLRRKNNASISLWSILFLLSIIFSGSSLYLAYISSSKIKAYCVLCILSYLISFLLFLLCLMVRKRFSEASLFDDIKTGFRYIFTTVALRNTILLLSFCLILVRISIPQYWNYEIPQPPHTISHGITSGNHPWIGAKKPSLIIKEYSDYQCFQCYKIHLHIRKLINQYPDKIRLVHHHYPIDHEFNPYVAPEPFHIGSGRLALVAIAALRQNKFWETNDRIFSEMQKKIKNVDINQLADDLNLDLNKLVSDINSPETIKILENDIKDGLRHEMTGTPFYVINGEVYIGSIPPEIIGEVTNQ